MRTTSFAMGALGAALLVAAPAAASPQDSRTRVDAISLDVKDAHLIDVLLYIKARTGRNLLIGGRGLKGWAFHQRPTDVVTVAFEEVPWETALRMVAESARDPLGRYAGGWLVRKPASNVWDVYRPVRVSVAVERGSFRALIFNLAKQANANIVIGNDVPDDLVISVRLKNVPFPHAMRAVTRAAGMALVVVGDDLTVGGGRTASRGRAAFRDVPVLMSIERKNATVRDLATMIARIARVKVIVSDGVAKDLKVTLALRDVTHRAALNKLASVAKLSLTRDRRAMGWRLSPRKKK